MVLSLISKSGISNTTDLKPFFIEFFLQKKILFILPVNKDIYHVICCIVIISSVTYPIRVIMLRILLNSFGLPE